MNKLKLAIDAARNDDIERVIKLLEAVLAEQAEQEPFDMDDHPPQREIEEAVKAERESCAKVCEPVEGSAYEVGVYKTMQTLAAAIRVRSEQ